MKKLLAIFILIFPLLLSNVYGQETKGGHYTEDWVSLSRHNEAPEWFKDAKFGIYFHWGVYSVPAFGDEWYPRWMHFKGKKEYEHHVETYGLPSEFGYHDFVPMFKAEKFDPNKWASLFKKAGAQFAGLVAEHHDGFSMWASKITPWNAMDKGPHRDIAGELEKAIKGNDMKFITTFHHAKNLQRYKGKEQSEIDSHKDNPGRAFWNSHYPLFAGMPPAMDDPELNYLYGNIPEAKWLEEVWFGKLKEVIDNYHPDIIWFDSWLDRIPEAYRKKFAVYYLNQAKDRNQEVVIVRKQNDLPLEMSVDDLEKSRKNRMGRKTWMTDETISNGSWCYTDGLQIKSSRDLVHILVDIVSKNGVLLLNISPKADGTIPEDQQETLLGIGKWLERFGESIYETRPWYTFGEGPTKEPEGNFRNHAEFLKIKYSEKDVRYTTRVGTIYATFLGGVAPGTTILLKSFAENELPDPVKIKDISLMGLSEKVNWKLMPTGLSVTIPDHFSEPWTATLKINIDDIDTNIND